MQCSGKIGNDLLVAGHGNSRWIITTRNGPAPAGEVITRGRHRLQTYRLTAAEIGVVGIGGRCSLIYLDGSSLERADIHDQLKASAGSGGIDRPYRKQGRHKNGKKN